MCDSRRGQLCREPRQPQHQSDRHGLDEDYDDERHPPHGRDRQLGDGEPMTGHGQREHVLGGGITVLPAKQVGDDERQQQHPADTEDQREHVEVLEPRRLKPGKARFGTQKPQLGRPPRFAHDPHEQRDPERHQREHRQGGPCLLGAVDTGRCQHWHRGRLRDHFR